MRRQGEATTSNALDVTLMGRKYRVTCTPDERDALRAAVAYVDRKMRELSRDTRVGGEGLVVIAALNIADDLLRLQQGGVGTQFKQRLSALTTRIDDALAHQEALF
jgi:cell division protein ZapA